MSQSNNVNPAVQLSADVRSRVEALRREDQSFGECLEQVISLGCYQLEYRRESADTRKAKAKALREDAKALRVIMEKASKDPELSVKLGLGTRVAL